jgi:hypothetical protein
VRTKIIEMKQHQQGVDEKLQVALRFIDWFTDYQQNK